MTDARSGGAAAADLQCGRLLLSGMLGKLICSRHREKSALAEEMEISINVSFTARNHEHHERTMRISGNSSIRQSKSERIITIPES
jgi:hypothetical protein